MAQGPSPLWKSAPPKEGRYPYPEPKRLPFRISARLKSAVVRLAIIGTVVALVYWLIHSPSQSLQESSEISIEKPIVNLGIPNLEKVIPEIPAVDEQDGLEAEDGLPPIDPKLLEGLSKTNVPAVGNGDVYQDEEEIPDMKVVSAKAPRAKKPKVEAIPGV